MFENAPPETDRAFRVEDPFSTEPVHGQQASWVVRDLLGSAEVLEGPMNHYDAMRALIRDGEEVICRAENADAPIVPGQSCASNWMSASTVDVTPALSRLEMQDFVDMLSDDFDAGPATGKVLEILREQGDPRAERLFLYTENWASPSEDGELPEARLSIDEASLMEWLEENRPEVHDEMRYRTASPTPDVLD